MVEGVIFDIKRFAVHDGPGIRTTVFLKGCPLRCAWCHNPESQAFGLEQVEGRDGTVSIGRVVPADEVVRKIERDASFYDESDGGVTFSGGEPMSQPEFLTDLLDRCGELDIHRAVDTCGQAPRDVMLNVAERTDLFLYDLKLGDDVAHRQYTGVDTTLIQGNLKALCDTGVAIEIRIPVVPGISDSERNLDLLGAVVESLSHSVPVRLLPYHRAAMDKYPRFGLTAPLRETPEPTGDAMERLRMTLESRGIEVRK